MTEGESGDFRETMSEEPSVWQDFFIWEMTPGSETIGKITGLYNKENSHIYLSEPITIVTN
ncbi:hypothetical protein ACWNXI_17600 [Caldibacillus thermoamylovorans]